MIHSKKKFIEHPEILLEIQGIYRGIYIDNRISHQSEVGYSLLFSAYAYDERMNEFFIILAIALIIWIVGTLLVIRGIEEPSSTLAEKQDVYTIRAYRCVHFFEF